MAERFDLDRFVQAQEPVIAAVRAELKAGRKTSHWMWFVFPQLAGLGRSPTAQFYAIRSASEARAYLAHPLLGARYREAVAAVRQWAGTRDAGRIFGETDAIKLRSSLTLFEAVSGDPLLADALTEFFDAPDPETLRLLKQA